MLKRLKSSLSSNKKQAKNFLIYAGTDGLSQALPFLVLPVIAGALGAENFGIVANFNVIVQLFTAILGMRLVFYYAADYHQVAEDQRKILISNIMGFYIITALVLLLASIFFGNNLTELLLLEKKWQYLALLIAFLLMIGQLLTTHLRMLEKVKLFGKLMISRSFISALGSILFVIVLDFSYPGRIYAMLLSALFLGGSAIYFFWKNGFLKLTIDWNLQKKLLLFGLPMLPYALSPWLRSGFEKIFITSEISLAENGIYALAGTFSAVFGLFSTAFLNTYTPTMYRILSQDKKNNTSLGRARITKQMLFFIIAFSIILYIGYWVLYLIFMNFFSTDYQRALVYLPIVLLGVAFAAFTNLFKALIIFTKKTTLFGIVGLCMSIIQVPLSYYLIVYQGTTGAAYASALGAFLLLVIYIAISHTYMPLPWMNMLRAVRHRG